MSITIEDVNSETLALTGDSSVFIPGYSTCRITWNYALSGVTLGIRVRGYKDGTSTTLYCKWTGNSTISGTFDVENVNYDSIYVEILRSTYTSSYYNGAYHYTYVLYTPPKVYQSQSFTLDYVEYTPPSVSGVVLERLSDDNTTATLTIGGSGYSAVNFGLIENELQVNYIYKAGNSGTYCTAVTIDDVAVDEDGNFEATVEFNDTDTFAVENTYYFTITASDKLISSDKDGILPPGVAALEIEGQDIYVGQHIYMNELTNTNKNIYFRSKTGYNDCRIEGGNGSVGSNGLALYDEYNSEYVMRYLGNTLKQLVINSDIDLQYGGYIPKSIPQIQYGKVAKQWVTTSAPGWQTIDVTFDETFSSVPVVTISVADPSVQSVVSTTFRYYISDVSTTGFTINVYNSAYSAGVSYYEYFHWQAMAKQE